MAEQQIDPLKTRLLAALGSILAERTTLGKKFRFDTEGLTDLGLDAMPSILANLLPIPEVFRETILGALLGVEEIIRKKGGLAAGAKGGMVSEVEAKRLLSAHFDGMGAQAQQAFTGIDAWFAQGAAQAKQQATNSRRRAQVLRGLRKGGK